MINSRQSFKNSIADQESLHVSSSPMGEDDFSACLSSQSSLQTRAAPKPLCVQLARNAGAKVIGLSSDANHKWLADHGVIPVTYGDGVEDRIRAASSGKVDAFVDTFGGGYVELALKLGVALNRIDTIIDFAAAAKYGVKTEGNHEAANADVLAELAGLLAAGRLEIPIAKVYPLAEVRDAYRELEQRHTRGKIVLEP